MHRAFETLVLGLERVGIAPTTLDTMEEILTSTNPAYATLGTMKNFFLQSFIVE